MRSQSEIARRIKQLEGNDPFSFETIELVPFLEYRRALKVKSFDGTRLINPVTTEKLWVRMTPERNDDMVYKIMERHLPSAWKRALLKRGISAQRNLIRYKAWFWLVGNDEMSQDISDYLAVEWGEKKDFGLPMLIVISEKLQFDWRSYLKEVSANTPDQKGEKK